MEWINEVHGVYPQLSIESLFVGLRIDDDRRHRTPPSFLVSPYLVYVFKTRTWRKIRSSSSFNFLPITRSPAVVNGALHWILLPDVENKGLPPCNSCGDNGIIVFRMDNEQFSGKPHPASHVCNGQPQEHTMMKLLVNEKETLYFCHMISSEQAVNIWMLEDYEMWAWNRMYKIDLFRYYSFA
ncbi:hypothetical protein BC332_12184 [Capsicum chinense]|nr:hypothetical protein BC332_12184 [Capsicum chinense]